LRAFPAMINVVPFTFFGARIAYSRAQLAELLCKLAAHRHQRRGRPADFCTFAVNLSAARHHFHVGFFQVRSSAELACLCASHAGVNAALPFCILKGRCTGHTELSRGSHKRVSQSNVIDFSEVTDLLVLQVGV
jgi:hypothetical protein